MTDRKRDPLPEGYQFGDARPAPFMCGMSGLRMMHIFEAHALVCNCGEKGRWPEITANVIEGEHFSTDRDTGDETTQ